MSEEYRISEIIEALKRALELHGDVPVYVEHYFENDGIVPVPVDPHRLRPVSPGSAKFLLIEHG